MNANPDQFPYTWNTNYGGVGVDSCVECHGVTPGSTLQQAHAPHLNASTNFGMNITCASCHGTSAQTALSHADGTINFLAGAVSFTYGAAADRVVQTTGGTFGSCGANACHNDGGRDGLPAG